MNAIAMLERCGKGQINQEFDGSLPPTYLTPVEAWRPQETLTEPTYPMACEDY